MHITSPRLDTQAMQLWTTTSLKTASELVENITTTLETHREELEKHLDEMIKKQSQLQGEITCLTTALQRGTARKEPSVSMQFTTRALDGRLHLAEADILSHLISITKVFFQNVTKMPSPIPPGMQSHREQWEQSLRKHVTALQSSDTLFNQKISQLREYCSGNKTALDAFYALSKTSSGFSKEELMKSRLFTQQTQSLSIEWESLQSQVLQCAHRIFTEICAHQLPKLSKPSAELFQAQTVKQQLVIGQVNALNVEASLPALNPPVTILSDPDQQIGEDCLEYYTVCLEARFIGEFVIKVLKEAASYIIGFKVTSGYASAHLDDSFLLGTMPTLYRDHRPHANSREILAGTTDEAARLVETYYKLFFPILQMNKEAFQKLHQRLHPPSISKISETEDPDGWVIT